MKTKLIAAALFAVTAGGIVVYPALSRVDTVEPPHPAPIAVAPQRVERPRIEVVFALDTTGSMGGLIQAAKEKIWSIATTMAQAQPAPEIRMGLVAYRDRGDAYVTQLVDLSSDLDAMYATLMEFNAAGGGDGPESVNQALDEAVNRISWSGDANTYKVVFLVGDAPPHMDYQDDVKYPQTLATARAKGIVVNSVQAGRDGSTQKAWQAIALAGQGQYAQVSQDGNAVAIATPYDKRMAELSAELDETRLYYGNAEEKAKRQLKKDSARKLHESASVASRARRATFNATKSGEANFAGEGELVEDLARGRVDLDSLAPGSLPEPLQALAPAEQKAAIAATVEKRAQLKSEIQALSKQRSEYLAGKVADEGGAAASLDDKLYGAIRAQAGKKGLRYEAAAPAY